MIKTDVNLHAFMDAQRPERLDDLIAQIQDEIAEVGLPAFLRTGYTSGKHRFKDACYLPDDSSETIANHIYGIYEYSEMTQISGLPLDLWVVREYLQPQSFFTAFDGLPISREVRIFCEQGIATQWQPYWPEHAIADCRHHAEPLPDDWRDRLAELNDISYDDLAHLKDASELATRIEGMHKYDWSIDWLWTEARGWVCIDMAEKHRSYKSPDIQAFV
ncbi:MAG: hypothetical protein AAGB19_09295 [Cyanobacteria bacterium P01_F01_bin.3]